MNQNNVTGLGWGERAPDFVAPRPDGTPIRFYAVAGGTPTVVFFCTISELQKLQEFSDALQRLSSDNIPIHIVVNSAPQPDLTQRPLSLFFDQEDKVRSAYRLQESKRTTALVFDSNLRMLGSIDLEQAEPAAQAVTKIIEASLADIQPLKIVTQAPILLIPRILDSDLCKHLMEVWETQGSEETGVEQSEEGRRKDTISHEHKQRRDHVVMDKELMKQLTMTIGRRVMPEVRKAFAYRATRFEGFKIACYDAATGGYFHAHRDNLSPSTAHRRFALTLNLNGGYEGGYLRFPEYGPHMYRPHAGDAIVFSSSHLHEVTPVTKGRRFTLLSFLFSEADVRTAQRK